MELDVAASRGQKCDVAAAVSGFSDASQAVHGSEEYELKEGTNTVLINELHEAVNAHPEDPSLHFDLGLFLWEKGPNSKENKERAANHFLTSAKLNPQNGAAFRYLGHYYASLSLDMQRALKCYQRAVTLNPDDSLSGEALCDLLDQGGKEIMQVSVCREASGKSPRAFWAFRRLGYLQVHQKKWSAAVQSLQHAIRGYPNCCDLWEALGLAYQRLGRFTAAIKSYGRAIELEDTSIFASIESGNIFLMLGSFRKGVEKFQHALEISPQNIAAQFGVSFGLLCLAKECIQLGAFIWASSLLEEASQVAEASTRLAGNLSCLWKLHGDIQLLYAKCFPWMDKSGGLERDVVAFNASILSWKKTCTLAAISASCSYQRALRLAPWQANIYTDIAIASDLTSHLNSGLGPDADIWKLPEKLALGSLLLEGDNYDFWVALGYLSHNNALKQHALIRGLQLDVALAFAWAHLGKLYRNMDEKQLARQAFDCARSIDPSLAIPWAGMSADFDVMESTSDEAFQSCLYAVQISPIAEFQIGLAKLALHSGQLSSSQLFRAICQAVQLAPHYPESHNLNGLVCEARLDYQSAATSYKRARCAVNISSDKVPKDLTRDISINLARSLSKVGNSGEALMECEILKKEGMLDIEGLQLYAFSLWQVGKNEEALSVARNLAGSISSIGGTSVAASVSFICRLLYSISGLDSAIISIQRMPKKMFQSSKISLVVSAIHAFDQSNRLESIVSSSRSFLNSHEEITRMHFLIALSKLVKNGSECSLGFQSGVAHLRKALHMYPNSNLIRNLLGYLLLFTEDSNHCHMATRCCKMYASNYQNQEGVKCATEILGAGAVACYSVGNSNPKFSFPTCKHQCLNDHGAVRELQRYLHQEPWNHNARYLLVLNFLQKAREERFPYHLGVTLGRLIKVALSCRLCSTKNMSYQYQKFQLLLCASELSLQGGNQSDCIEHAKNASVTLLPDNYLFFVHLMLCRAYAAENDVTNLQMEYIRCLELKTDYQFGWICLKFMESQYNLQENLKRIDLIYEECSKGGKDLWNISMPLFYLLKGLISIRDQDLVSAEECLSQACSFAYDESCLFLCHGATCIELSRKLCSSHYLLLAVKSLTRAQETCVISVPIVSILLAQAKGSLGSKESWEKNLRLEWYSWPPEMRPAELFFQMHVLGRQAMGKEYGPTSSNVELCQSPKRWVLRAIHTNPSCMRFWEVLQKVAE